MTIIGAFCNAIETWKVSHEVVWQNLNFPHTSLSYRNRMQATKSSYKENKMVEIVHFKFTRKTASRRHGNPAKRANKRNSDALQFFSYLMLLSFLVESWGTFMGKKNISSSSAVNPDRL